MKLRGLNTILAILVVASALLIASRYLKSENSDFSDDTKFELTGENQTKNPIKKLRNVIVQNLTKQTEMTERLDFDDSALTPTKERFYTESEIVNMSEEEFKSLLKETELKLPKRSDLKELPAAALHRTPTPILEAGRNLGLIKEILRAHESYEKLALALYETCAKNADRPTPVRALCLTNLVEVKKKNGEKINLDQYPAQLVELTKMITGL